MSSEEKEALIEEDATVDAGAEAASNAESERQESEANLDQDLARAEAEAKEHWEHMLRAKAELENLRKRSARELENAHKYGLEKLYAELLPVRDSMQLGLSAASGEVEIQAVREGMELTLKMLDGALEKFGGSEVNPAGEKFDPELHQAISMLDAGDAEPGSVVDVVQKGYVLNERLIRPAMVVVAKG